MHAGRIVEVTSESDQSLADALRGAMARTGQSEVVEAWIEEQQVTVQDGRVSFRVDLRLCLN